MLAADCSNRDNLPENNANNDLVKWWKENRPLAFSPEGVH